MHSYLHLSFLDCFFGGILNNFYLSDYIFQNFHLVLLYVFSFFAETVYVLIFFKHSHNCSFRLFYNGWCKIFTGNPILCHLNVGVGVDCLSSFNGSKADFPDSWFDMVFITSWTLGV